MDSIEGQFLFPGSFPVRPRGRYEGSNDLAFGTVEFFATRGFGDPNNLGQFGERAGSGDVVIPLPDGGVDQCPLIVRENLFGRVIVFEGMKRIGYPEGVELLPEFGESVV